MWSRHFLTESDLNKDLNHSGNLKNLKIAQVLYKIFKCPIFRNLCSYWIFNNFIDTIFVFTNNSIWKNYGKILPNQEMYNNNLLIFKIIFQISPVSRHSAHSVCEAHPQIDPLRLRIRPPGGFRSPHYFRQNHAQDSSADRGHRLFIPAEFRLDDRRLTESPQASCRHSQFLERRRLQQPGAARNPRLQRTVVTCDRTTQWAVPAWPNSLNAIGGKRRRAIFFIRWKKVSQFGCDQNWLYQFIRNKQGRDLNCVRVWLYFRIISVYRFYTN